MKKSLTLALAGAVILVLCIVSPVFSGAGSRYSLKLEEIEGRGTLVSLSTNDENVVGLVLRDDDQKRNLVALLVEEAPDQAKDSFALVSADSVLRVNAETVSSVAPTFVIEEKAAKWNKLDILVIKQDGTVLSIPISVVGYEGSPVSIEIESRPTKKANGRCLTYTAFSSSCGSFSKTCCVSGSVCIDYTSCSISCSGCTS